VAEQLTTVLTLSWNKITSLAKKASLVLR